MYNNRESRGVTSARWQSRKSWTFFFFPQTERFSNNSPKNSFCEKPRNELRGSYILWECESSLTDASGDSGHSPESLSLILNHTIKRPLVASFSLGREGVDLCTPPSWGDFSEDWHIPATGMERAFWAGRCHRSFPLLSGVSGWKTQPSASSGEKNNWSMHPTPQPLWGCPNS